MSIFSFTVSNVLLYAVSVEDCFLDRGYSPSFSFSFG